jgi:hypothetical protein
MSNLLNIVWEKCRHGFELRHGRCSECEKEKQDFLKVAFERRSQPPTRIPIYRGCDAKSGCFCSGACKEIIGYRDPLPGENKERQKYGI